MKSYLEEIFSNKFNIIRVNKQGSLLTYKDDINTSVYIGWTNLGQSITIDSIIGLRYFEKIEKAVRPILKENEINYPSFGNIESTYNYFVRCSKNEVEKDDNGGIRELLYEVDETIKNIEEDCFNITETITDLKNYIKDFNEEELSEFLCNPVLIRKYAINYLIDQDDNDLCSMVSEYESAIKSYPQIFANHDKALLALDKHLKNNHPA